MKKKFKVLGLALTLTMGLSMLSGCGKSDNQFKNAQEMIDKYAPMCALGDYKGVEYVEKKTEVTDEDVQAKIDSLLEEKKNEEQVKTGKTENGQTVNIDFVGSVDGEEFQGGSTNGAGYNLELGSGSMIPGFEEQIVGHEVGESFDIDVTFPDDYGNSDLAGQDAVFNITINYIVNVTLPEYTDEFVAANTTYSNITDYEASVREELEASNKSSDENTNKVNIMTVVVDNATVNEYPKQEMQKLVDETIADVEEAATSYGYDLETYVTSVYGMSSEDSFREYLSNMAQNYMKEKIIVCAIAKAEGINVNQDELNDFKQELMTNAGFESEEKLKEYYTDDDVLYFALSEKVVAFLLENGVGVDSLDTEEDAEAVETEETTEAAE